MRLLMRQHDWDNSPPGPMAQWPQSLRTAVSICLASRFPIIIFWGQELRQFYNDAYRPILGATKHPSALGARAEDCWNEIWDVIGPMLNGVLTMGEATWSENQLLLMDRYGYVEETYFTFSYSPIRVERGKIGGVFCAVTETTGEVLSERRLRTLRALATNMTAANNPGEVCMIAAKSLANDLFDVPFALLYLLRSDGRQAELAGTTGLLSATETAGVVNPLVFDLDMAKAVWPLAKAVASGQPESVKDLKTRFGSLALFEHPERPTPREALILPIKRGDDLQPYGFIIAGISSRLLLNEEYFGFLTLVAGQIATAIVTARAYQDARERVESLAELDRAKTVFFSNVSHEFRTPLTLLLGPIEALLADCEHPLAEEQRAQVEMVRRNALRLLKLVNTLLDFAHIESGRINAVYEPIDLAALTSDLASTFRSAIEEAGIRFIVVCPPLGEEVYVDREMWEKIVLNLLSNAFKFTFAGEIRLLLNVVDAWVELTIEDSGNGISDSDLPHVFERFYRARAERARTQEGSGIGLSLVQELVRLHGGTLRVSSKIGKGTTFTVSIPRGSAHLPTERIGAPRSLASTARGAAPYVEEAWRWLPEKTTSALTVSEEVVLQDLPIQGSGKQHSTAPSRVLIVDDNADMRDYLERLLSPYYTLQLAHEGNMALEIARAWLPDLILSDVMMPGLDGFALLEALQADEKTRAIPIILLSGRAGVEATIEGMKAGANDYLVKPFSAREALARVEAQLEIARLREKAVENERAQARTMQQLAQENAQLYNQAQEAIHDRDELLAMVSHDLKNPLGAIKGFAQIMQRRLVRMQLPPDEALDKGLSQIESIVNRLTAQVNDLLNLTHARLGQELEIVREETNLAHLTSNVIAELQQTTNRHQILLENGEIELVGYVDTIRFERVLLNLISNAIKYDPDGNAIIVRLARESIEGQAYACITIEDHGLGIPESDVPYIFQRFHRAGNVVGKIRGTGIGLASVYEIVTLHGGTISVSSQEGKGSVFTVRLPLAPVLSDPTP